MRVAKRTQNVSAALILYLFSFAALLAHPEEKKADAQTKADAGQAWVGARIIDGTGRTAIENATLFIRNGRIVAVGTKVKLPRGVRKIDASGKTIVPGFINDHAHLNVDRDFTGNVREDLIRRLKMYANYGVTSTVGSVTGTVDSTVGQVTGTVGGLLGTNNCSASGGASTGLLGVTVSGTC